MTERYSRIAVVTAFLCGAVAGGICGTYFAPNILADMLYEGRRFDAAIDVQQRTHTLRHLKEGRPDRAEELLEVDLDADLIVLRLSGAESTDTTRIIKRAITLAKTYRRNYPRTSQLDPIRDAITEVFQQTNEP